MLFEERRDDKDVVSMQVWHAPGRTKPTFDEAKRATGYKTFKKGDHLGPSWTNHWVKMSIRVGTKAAYSIASDAMYLLRRYLANGRIRSAYS